MMPQFAVGTGKMLTKSQELAKRCVHLVVHKLGGQRSAEQFTGIDNTRISKFSNPARDDQHVKLFEFLDLDEAAQFEGLKLLAMERGFHLATREQMRELANLPREIQRLKLLADMSVSIAEHIAKTERAAEDGVCTHNEGHELTVSSARVTGSVADYTGSVIAMPRQRGA